MPHDNTWTHKFCNKLFLSWQNLFLSQCNLPKIAAQSMKSATNSILMKSVKKSSLTPLKSLNENLCYSLGLANDQSATGRKDTDGRQRWSYLLLQEGSELIGKYQIFGPSFSIYLFFNISYCKFVNTVRYLSFQHF